MSTASFVPTRTDWTWLCALLVVTGMIWSPFLQSMAQFGLAAAAVFTCHWGPAPRLLLRRDWGTHWAEFRSRPDYWAMACFFLVIFIGIWPLHDPAYWWERARIKVPFLVMPWVFFLLPRFSAAYWQALLLAIIGLLTLTTFGVFGYYLLHFAEVQRLIDQGQPMPLPSNHIRFSLLLALGILNGIHLLQTVDFARSWQRWLLRAATLWLFLFMHILAVRSGLAALYLALLGLSVQYAGRSGRWWLVPSALGALVGLLVLSYWTIPSFQTKLNYVRWDLTQAAKTGTMPLSDSDRLRSLQVGWALFQAAPLTGVGPGNLRQAVERHYFQYFPTQEKRLQPHNQFLFVLAGSGLLGLLVFLPGVLLPVFFRQNYRQPLLLGFFLVTGASLLVEATFENAMGVAIYTFFLLLYLGQVPTRHAFP